MKIKQMLLVVVMLMGFTAIAQNSVEQQLEKGIKDYEAKKYEDAATGLRPLAEQGNAEAQYYLGQCYYFSGRYSWDKFDRDQGLYWIRKAATAGNVDAQKSIAWIFSNTNRDIIDIQRYWLQRAADQGDKGAQRRLGDLYGDAYNAPLNCKLAVYWWEKGVEKDGTYLQTEIGDYYYLGKGVDQDYSAAVTWYTKAADQGSGDARYKLGMCYFEGKGVARNYIQAVKLFEKSNTPQADKMLVTCYTHGYGVKKDLKKAEEYKNKKYSISEAELCVMPKPDPYPDHNYTPNSWLLKSAEEGCVDAQYEIGIGFKECYNKDLNMAKEWLTKAANQGVAMAQYELGAVYGKQRDNATAVEWFRKAAEQNYYKAINVLANCYKYGGGVKQNKEEAVKWYAKAAELGYAEAQYNLGEYYLSQNNEEAVKWYAKAARQGHRYSINELKELAKKGNADAIEALEDLDEDVSSYK